jgi:homoserine O-acetyltransferase
MDAHDLSHPSSVISCDPPSLSTTLPPLPPHDATGDADADDAALQSAWHHALSLLPPALVIGIESDGLFTTSEQRELAAHIPESELVVIPSPDGHDGFLLEFEAINGWIEGWLRRKVPEYYAQRVIEVEEYGKGEEGWGVKKESVFGEAEADVTAW